MLIFKVIGQVWSRTTRSACMTVSWGFGSPNPHRALFAGVSTCTCGTVARMKHSGTPHLYLVYHRVWSQFACGMHTFRPPPKRVRVTFPPPYMQYRDSVSMLECMVKLQRKRLHKRMYIYMEVGHGVCGYNTCSMSRTCTCVCVVFVLHLSPAHAWRPCRCMVCGTRASF